ncbi:hypothetical protein [Roseospira navarrensis]|uniref:Peptidase C39 domain-containing protein n=1 Tax=Roseospira navarrensis TaxID=140058 RepID=A0A7X1ZF36_9PROT|nr:hypothetical protein [Roseospira navarrensis]MQX37128.1 hypothetical protein [Roseospira navarrensis]
MTSAPSHDPRPPAPPSPSAPAVNGCFLDRLVLIAADRGLVADRTRLAEAHGIAGDGFPIETVLAVAAALGLNARHARLSWADLATLGPSGAQSGEPSGGGSGPEATALPALLIFRDGATAILDAIDPGTAPMAEADGPARVLLRNEGPPELRTEAHLALDRTDLALFWGGDAILPGPPVPAAR